MKLIPATDAHFAWMLAGEGGFEGLNLPEGGVDRPGVLKYLRRVAEDLRTHHGPGSWLVVVDGTVAGLCGYKHGPSADGAVEIGYGIVAARRGQGLATRAVAEILILAAGDARIHRLTAETAADNIASQRVLAANGFVQAGSRLDPEDGLLILWQASLS